MSRDGQATQVGSSISTDHMTYDQSLFRYMTSPSRESAITADGDITLVTGAGSIALTLSLLSHHPLFVPTLYNHPLSVEQVVEQVGCEVLMFPTFYLL